MTHQQAALPYVLYAKSYFEALRRDCLNVTVAENAVPSFELYPNPASSIITLKSFGEPEFSEVRIFDAQLRVVYAANYPAQSIDISHFPNGNYLVELRNKQRAAAYRMFVKQ
jgi:hypothetical protein